MIELLSVFLPQPFIKPVLLFIIFTVVFFVVRHFFDPIYQKIKTAFQSQMGELSTLLDRDFIKISTEKLSKIFLGYYSFWFLSGTFLFFPHFLIGMVLGVLFVLAASRLPKVLVNGYHNRRVGRFGMQLVDALTLMSNGLRSGLNITQTIDLVSAEMSNPIAQEFRLIINETQLGTSVDFTTSEIGGTFSKFEKNLAYEWLQDNAHKYGFSLSYPEGNTYYKFESWHWRFIGVELATFLHGEGRYFYDLNQREIDEYLIKLFD